MNPQTASFEITIRETPKGDENQVVGNIGGTYITLLVPPQVKSKYNNGDSNKSPTRCNNFPFFLILILYSRIRASQYDSVEVTNKMQPCNRIYYSTVH